MSNKLLHPYILHTCPYKPHDFYIYSYLNQMSTKPLKVSMVTYHKGPCIQYGITRVLERCSKYFSINLLIKPNIKRSRDNKTVLLNCRKPHTNHNSWHSCVFPFAVNLSNKREQQSWWADVFPPTSLCRHVVENLAFPQAVALQRALQKKSSPSLVNIACVPHTRWVMQLTFDFWPS